MKKCAKELLRFELGYVWGAKGVYRILKRHGLNRLPRNVGRRAVHTARYAKQVPCHHIQVDVKFLSLKRSDGATVRRPPSTMRHG